MLLLTFIPLLKLYLLPGYLAFHFVCCQSLSCVQLCDPMDPSLPDLSVRGISQARILEWGAICSLGDLPDPGIEPVSPALAG